MNKPSPSVAAILLAGGVGSRMNSAVPKQYLPLGGKAIAEYAFDCLRMTPGISEIVVVCADEFRCYFESAMPDITLTFARPGERRQDSVYNGYYALLRKHDLVCVHDAARPFITPQLVNRVVEAAYIHGAATLGVPLKFTVREVNDSAMSVATPDRSRFWEIQTPQCLKRELLVKGFEHADLHQLMVTDDVSFAEIIDHPVKIVEGDYHNLKITTVEDLFVAEKLLELHSESLPALSEPTHG